jgi:hypothetical protein
MLETTINDASDTGYLYALVTRRMSTLTLQPLAVPIATKDWFAELVASTEAALSIVLGTAANNTITIAAAGGCQLASRGAPTPAAASIFPAVISACIGWSG